ncbi:MAG: lipopolysaccharide biosynthesis protein [Phycisphaerae bacterium]
MAEITARGLARNSAYALVAQLWRVGSRFILTPLIIAKIGLDGYGVWTLLFVICAYVTAIDVNFGVAYSKYTAEYDAKRDYDRLAQIVGSGMTLIGSIAAVALTVIWFFRAPILRTLGVPAEMLEQAGQALLLVSICVVMRMSIGCVFSIVAGLQRIDIRYKLSILAAAIEFIITIVLLIRGWKLLALAFGHFCGQVVSTAIAWRSCRRLCPDLSLSPLRTSVFGIRQIFSLGGRFQLLSAVQVLIHQCTKLLLSGLLGVSMLGISEIATKLISLGVAVGGAVVAPIMPAFSNLYSLGDRERIRGLYERASRAVALVCVPSFAFLAIFADRIILLWTNQEYPLAAWTVRWIAPVAFLGMLTGIGTAALRGKGTIRLELFYALIGLGMLVVLYPPGYLLWGYKGMIGAEVIAGILSAAWFLWALARTEFQQLLQYVRATIWRPVAVFSPLFVLSVIVAPQVHIHAGTVRARVGCLIDVAFVGSLFAVISVALIWYGLLTTSERVWFTCRFPGAGGTRIRRLLRCPAAAEPKDSPVPDVRCGR